MQIIRQKAFLRSTLILPLFCVCGVAGAQESQRQKPEQSQQQNPYRDQAHDTQHDQRQNETQSYAGKIGEKFGKYYLENTQKRTSYQLEGSWDVKKFLNKKVRITGTLDSDRNILHVVAIALIPDGASPENLPPKRESP